MECADEKGVHVCVRAGGEAERMKPGKGGKARAGQTSELGSQLTTGHRSHST
jgi:hypothetical protein